MKNPEVASLYKYKTFTARNLSMLANNEIYFSPSNVFNDAFDCLARKEMEFANRDDLIAKMALLETHHQQMDLPAAIKYVEERTKNKDKTDRYIDEKSKMFQKIVLQTFGIFSTSKRKEDILMWSHYSNGHTGFCIEFDRSDDNFLCDATAVNYPDGDDFPYINYWIGSNEDQINELKKIIFTKSKHWAYEEEWRIVEKSPNSNSDSIDLNYIGHLK